MVHLRCGCAACGAGTARGKTCRQTAAKRQGRKRRRFCDVRAELEGKRLIKGDSPGRRREKEKRPEKGVILIDGI